MRALVEGSSIRSITRMSGSSKGAILRLLVEVGEFCALYQDHALRNLPCKRVEADEVWGFCVAKQKNATKPEQGDLWTYTAICADSKLVRSWLVGKRNHMNTRDFMADVASRLKHRVQLTTDGVGWYLSTVEQAFGWNGCDYARLQKTYGMPQEESGQRRYSPLVCTGAIKTPVMGNPESSNISTS